MSEQNLVDAPDQFGGDGFEAEEFEGGNEGGGPIAPGMGQSKSSRRRRRKRKNKLIAATSPSEGGVPADPYNPSAFGSRSVSGTDLPHVLSVNTLAQSPIGAGKRFSTGLAPTAGRVTRTAKRTPSRIIK